MTDFRTGTQKVFTLLVCVCLMLSVSFFSCARSLEDSWQIRIESLLTADEIMDASISQLLEYMEQGRLTSEELTSMYLERIETYDKSLGLNSFITVNPAALEEARAADEARANGETGRLLGIPIVIKDNINVKGLPTTNGYAGSRGKASSDSEVVRRLKAEGAVIIGKGNMSAGSMSGTTTRSSSGGTAHNPYDLTRTPAGSSGGPAIAVTCNFAAAGIGSDTGSSIRRPASFANIYGYRPSAGLVSRRGLIVTHGLYDTIGILARSAGDTALLLDIISGSDSSDSYSSKADQLKPEKSYTESLGDIPMDGLRIGYLSNSFGYYVGSGGTQRSNPTELSPHISGMVDNALSVFTSNGAELVDMSEQLTEPYIRRLSWMGSARARETMKKIFEENGISALVYVSQTDVPEIERKAIGRYNNWAYYISVFSPKMGLPEIMVPMGLSETDPENGVTEPMPLGLSIVGLHGEDAVLLAIASEYDRLSDMRYPPASVPALADGKLESFGEELLQEASGMLSQNDLSYSSANEIRVAYDALNGVCMTEEEGRQKVPVEQYKQLACALCGALDSAELIVSEVPVHDIYTRSFFLERYRNELTGAAVSVGGITLMAVDAAVRSHRKKKIYSDIPKKE